VLLWRLHSCFTLALVLLYSHVTSSLPRVGRKIDEELLLYSYFFFGNPLTPPSLLRCVWVCVRVCVRVFVYVPASLLLYSFASVPMSHRCVLIDVGIRTDTETHTQHEWETWQRVRDNIMTTSNEQERKKMTNAHTHTHTHIHEKHKSSFYGMTQSNDKEMSVAVCCSVLQCVAVCALITIS